MALNKKMSVALLLVPIAIFALFIFRVYESYESFTSIPHYDLTMWIFMLLFGLVFALMFLAALIFIVTVNDESVEDGSYLDSFDLEEHVETSEPVIEEEIVEEEVVEELEVEVPEELQDLSIDDLEPEEQAARKKAEAEDQAPEIWKEEEFE